MLKCVLSFIGGCVTVIAVVVVLAIVSYRRVAAPTAAPAKTGPPTATVTIHVTENPDELRLGKDASAVLDQITNLTDAERKKIRDAIASGLVTSIELERDADGESQLVTIPVRSNGVVMRMSTKVHFGPAEMHVEDPKAPNKPTVTPRGK